MHVAVVGSLAYVADQFAGLRVIDVATPATPVELGAIDPLSTSVTYVEIVADRAYTCGIAKMEIIDISNSAAPIEVGFFFHECRGVDVVGNFAYAINSQGLRIVDLSIPQFPAEIGTLEISQGASHVEVVGSIAYVTTGLSSPTPRGCGSSMSQPPPHRSK